MFRILSALAFALAVYSAVRIALLDRRLQAFRSPGVSRSQFWLVPWRIQEDFYTAEGRPLVRKFWSAWRSMLAWFLVGSVLVLLAG
jgi:hypothetical protein